jgi:ADP-heptose:LPS heptosyltransferase
VLYGMTDSHCGRAVVCGTREERNLCSRVIGEAGKEAFNLAGETSLTELVEIIRRAAFLVGNESAAIHIAAAVGTPSVCILGGGHYGRFMPYGVETGDRCSPIPVIHRMDCFNCDWQCTQPHQKGEAVPCITGITVDQVLKAMEGINYSTISRG